MLIQCRDCGLEKPFAEMAKDRRRDNGTKNRCLECQKRIDAVHRRAKGMQEVIPKSFYFGLSQQHAIEGRRILGRLCDKGHKWNGLEYSLRMVNRHGETGQCIECKREYARVRNNTPEVKQRWHENKDRYRLNEWFKNPRISPSVVELVEKERHHWSNKDRVRYWTDAEYREQKKLYAQIREHSNPRNRAGRRALRSQRVKEQSDGTLTKEAVSTLLGQSKACPYCKEKYDNRRMHRKTLDHVIPISKGGAHSIHNVIVCCFQCNTRKGVAIPRGEIKVKVLLKAHF